MQDAGFPVPVFAAYWRHWLQQLRVDHNLCVGVFIVIIVIIINNHTVDSTTHSLSPFQLYGSLLPCAVVDWVTGNSLIVISEVTQR